MKGSSHIDWIISFVIFLSGLIIAITYMNYLSKPKIPEEKIIASALIEVNEEIENLEIPVNVYKLRTLKICVRKYPCELTLQNMKNISVMNNKNEKRVFYYKNPSLRTLVDWCEENKILESNESAVLVSGDAWVTQTSAGNTYVEITYNSTHLTSMKYNANEFLVKATNLSTSQILSRKSDATRSEVIFDTVNITIDSFSPRIWFDLSGKNINFTLKYFQNCYIANTLYDCSNINTIQTTSNLTSLYNDTLGISFIGNNLNISVINENNQSIVIEIKNPVKFEIFFHDGNYSLAQNESKAFFENCEISPYLTLYPLSYRKLQSYGLNISVNFNYRIEIENLTYGKNIPLVGNIFRREIPYLMFRNGTLNTTIVKVWIWP